MKRYIATIAVGPGTKDNTYQAEFWADDEEHAREQADDHIRTTDVEWVVTVQLAR